MSAPTGPAVRPVPTAELASLVEGRHAAPHGVLGAHPYDGAVTVRAFKPLAASVVVRYATVEDDWAEVELQHEHGGIWVGCLPVAEVPDYRLRVTYGAEPDQHTHEVDDPYRFLPTLGEVDLHLINEGRHEQLWQVLGARVHHYSGFGTGEVTGTSFAVWAPRARGVRLEGDFNNWDGREHPMRQLDSSGVWELFVPGVGSGTRYKYIVLGADDQWREKADPMAAWAEVPPSTSSVVFESQYTWGDDAWLERRRTQQAVTAPMSVYEVHLGSWRRGRSYAQLADELVEYVADLGFTHVELMPVMQHPFGGSWGYHVTSYFAPDSRLGTPDDFRYLVDRLHQAGIGVILDWVPGHFATDEWALARFDGAPLYEHPDPRRGWHQEWGSHIFDFGRPEVRNYLYANAVYWLEEFHADGLRVDGVASMLYLDYARNEGEWVPNVHGGRENLEAVQFLQEMNATVYKRVPGVTTIAEESTSWPGVTRPTSSGGLGFGFKWNMGWMHDTLDYLQRDPVHRSYHHHDMTFALTYAWSENYVLPLSHDEVVHGKGSLLRKMPGDRWRQLATLRAYLAFMWAHPGKQLLFMGGEIGQESEWAESRELDWWLLEHPEHRGVHDLVRDLNRAYRDTPAAWQRDHEPEGFGWIDADDAARNVYSFVRRGGEGAADLVCVANFSAVPHDYRLALPSPGPWTELLNTDADVYGGSGVGNLGTVTALPRGDGEPGPLPAYADIAVPPLGTLWLRAPQRPAAEAAEAAEPAGQRTSGVSDAT
ncbi:MAG TPA: 1,4-alpha-glucan branching protein GlgB [Nocardioides sp.]|uniref:1,4-alpha-glucan branching protein GlgB n=1 Tax=Nocardioides sp. TaxID=35761 RepID=UPI002EDAF171